MTQRARRATDASSGARPAAGRGMEDRLVEPFEVVPLPFDASTLQGISERMITSHHDNNYAGTVRSLNALRERLARRPEDAPAWEVAGLKERELTFSNSIVYHELYFANLGGDGAPAGEVQRAISSAYGGFGRWEQEFHAVGMSLSGGSGWTVLQYDLHGRRLRTHWSGNHSQGLVSALPLLVMDMYEHAYHIDYGADAEQYIDAFLRNVLWEEVERRYQSAVRAARALDL